jgi:hypothetical protein
MSRRLLETRRRAGPARRGDYREHWLPLRRAVEAAGAKAWAFVARDGDQVVEFVESAELSRVLADAAVAAAAARLERAYPHLSAEEWRPLDDG